MTVAAILAMLALVAVPALAQVAQEVANEDETCNVDLSFSAQSTGNSANQCVTPLQFGNTGSNQNAQGFLQYNSTAGDLEAEGGEFVFAPELSGGWLPPGQ